MEQWNRHTKMFHQGKKSETAHQLRNTLLIKLTKKTQARNNGSRTKMIEKETAQILFSFLV
jgi:hypothetical protein